LVFCDEIWTSDPQQFCALRGVARCVLTRCPTRRWIRWAASDCFKRTI